MPVETFAGILKLAEQGATVVLEKMPVDVPGMGDLEVCRRQLKQMTSSLKFADAGNGMKTSDIGSGQIITSSDVQKALQYKKIHGENLTASGLKFVRRDVRVTNTITLLIILLIKSTPIYLLIYRQHL
jgi:hypothetical protein